MNPTAISLELLNIKRQRRRKITALCITRILWTASMLLKRDETSFNIWASNLPEECWEIFRAVQENCILKDGKN
jgi:hypothetical protein